MPCQRSIDSYLCRFLGSRLSDQDDVRIMSEDSLEPYFVGISFAIVDLRLLDSFDLVLDRILECDDLSLAVIEITQDRIERRGLSCSCRSGEYRDTGILADISLEDIIGPFCESYLLEG